MSDEGAGGAGAGGWCTIESDPGVFTSLVESFGCRGVEFAELWSLDDDSLKHVVEDFGEVYGLIFLFKWDKELEGAKRQKTDGNGGDGGGGGGGSGGKAPEGDDAPSDLFFARQVTHNACATQAILSVLLNAEGAVEEADDNADNADAMDEDKKEGDEASASQAPPDARLVLGPTLSALRSFASSLPPDLRGEAISSSDDVRNAHNSFARRDAFLTDPEDRRRKARDGEEGEDVFHFVAYVPHSREDKGEEAVYELDGLNAGPVKCGDFKTEGGANRTLEWMAVARTAIQDRIEKYAASEIKFNLMAVVRDRRVGIKQKLSVLTAAAGTDEEGAGELGEEASRLHAELERERGKRERWDAENARRRHNYLPFCVELIRALAGSGKLPDLTKKANERAAEARKKAIQKKLEMAGKEK